jgi:Na+-translocating ferredoxin:NAD+ oxidoreductase subunit B
MANAWRAGLVLQPANSQNPIVMCTCCSCCCGVLRNIKNHPEPSALVANSFIARYDAEACIDCGKCVLVCPMEALAWADEVIAFNPARCIGCGLCVGVCPTQAVVMVRKGARLQAIPKNTLDTYLRMALARGPRTVLTLVGMALRPVVHSALAPK